MSGSGGWDVDDDNDDARGGWIMMKFVREKTCTSAKLVCDSLVTWM